MAVYGTIQEWRRQGEPELLTLAWQRKDLPFSQKWLECLPNTEERKRHK